MSSDSLVKLIKGTALCHQRNGIEILGKEILGKCTSKRNFVRVTWYNTNPWAAGKSCSLRLQMCAFCYTPILSLHYVSVGYNKIRAQNEDLDIDSSFGR